MFVINLIDKSCAIEKSQFPQICHACSEGLFSFHLRRGKVPGVTYYAPETPSLQSDIC